MCATRRLRRRSSLWNRIGRYIASLCLLSLEDVIGGIASTANDSQEEQHRHDGIDRRLGGDRDCRRVGRSDRLYNLRSIIAGA